VRMHDNHTPMHDEPTRPRRGDSSTPARAGRRRFDDDELLFDKRGHRRHLEVVDDDPGDGQRWSTWDQSTPTERGPRPHPDWLVTELAAIDTELGVLKTGKEADVYLVERAVPGTPRSCMLAAKRYRTAQHRMFHRDAGYLEGRRVRQTRTNRAMAGRTAFGKEAIAGVWASAEFGALCTLWRLGVRVPYPVQILGTEVLLEFIGTPDGSVAAPRLAQLRADTADLPDLWRQLVAELTTMARAGYTHGDLSAYNLLVQDGKVVIIDLPQIVDVVANPQGREFLVRDVHNVAAWFRSHGVAEADGDELSAQLRHDAGLR
jgi:RIO kinase 1